MACGLAASSSCRCASTPSFCSPGSAPRSHDESDSTSCRVIVSCSPLGLDTTHRSSPVDERVRGVHPVQRLVGAAVGVDRDAPVGLDHDQPHGLGEVGGQPPGVVHRAPGDDEPHAGRRYRRSRMRCWIRARRACSSRWVSRSTLGSSPKPALTPSRSTATSLMPELAAELLAVALGEHHRDVGDLAEDVEVGGEAGDGAVEEHEVLDVQHQLLGHPRAVAEQALDDALDLLDELVAGQRRRVDGRLVEAEVADHGPQVGVGRQRAEVAQRGHLALEVVRRRRHHQPQEGDPPLVAEPADDAEVEQPGAAVGQHEQVAAVEVAVEDAG